MLRIMYWKNQEYFIGFDYFSYCQLISRVIALLPFILLQCPMKTIVVVLHLLGEARFSFEFDLLCKTILVNNSKRTHFLLCGVEMCLFDVKFTSLITSLFEQS